MQGTRRPLPAGKCLEPESADVQMHTLHPKQGPRGSPVAALLRDRRGSFRPSFCHVAECRQCRQRWVASVAVSLVSTTVCQIQSEHPLQPSAALFYILVRNYGFKSELISLQVQQHCSVWGLLGISLEVNMNPWQDNMCSRHVDV